MNRTNTSNRRNLWRAGLTLVLSAAAVAACLWLVGLWAHSSVWSNAPTAADRYYVYGRTASSVGDRWEFRGVHDDVYAAAKAASAVPGGKIFSADRLPLPPASDRVVYRLDRDAGREWVMVGTYHTPGQAAAAAEQIVARGGRFEVTYDCLCN